VSRNKPTNLAASVRQKLLNLSRAEREDFQLVLTRYMIERLLYRLSRSGHARDFVLKGAMLFTLWAGKAHRPTRDVDLLGHGDPTAQRLASVFTDLCTLEVAPDGLSFDAGSIEVSEIAERQEYGGQRVNVMATLTTAHMKLQIDVGFGDAVTPRPVEAEYPTLLAMPAPRLQTYPRETVIAEKLQAIVSLGIANGRMKDFYDLWVLAQGYAFGGQVLVDAFRATFSRRQTQIPDGTPTGLTDEFANDEDKVKLWRPFMDLRQLGAERPLAEVIGALRTFLLPPLHAAAGGSGFGKSWAPGGPWR